MSTLPMMYNFEERTTIPSMYRLEDLDHAESRHVVDPLKTSSTAGSAVSTAAPAVSTTYKSTVTTLTTPVPKVEVIVRTPRNVMSEFITGGLGALSEGEQADVPVPADLHGHHAEEEALKRLAESPVWGMKIGVSSDATTGSPDRQPRIIEKKKTQNSIHGTDYEADDYGMDYEEFTTEDIFSGQYLEVNPGQYHEVNPGQYTEVNPGQYTEVNPGQYTEVNPGQYEEVHPGQDLKIDDVTVDVANKDHTKIYNVQAKAGDFIIGEVGKINVNNGQTFQGVRYTAVDGYLDQGQISDILKQFFGTQTT